MCSNEFDSGVYRFGGGTESCSRNYGRPNASWNMHRVYQYKHAELRNLSINGAKSSSMLSKISQCYSVTNSTTTAAAEKGACVAGQSNLLCPVR